MELLTGILAIFGILATIIGTIQFFEYIAPRIRALISRLSGYHNAEISKPPGSVKFRPPLFSLPPISRQLFGREKIIKEMKEWIAKGAERVLVIEGIGGIG